ncbi:MAG: ABC transporter ATP-binding protein [Phototrophicaceae bacterium]
MFRVAKYAKPFTGMVLIAIVLLFFQAIADLSLPTYTADIVNVGIQQGGVETAVPIAIRESQMNKLMLFINEEDATTINEAYTLVEPNTAEATIYSEDYPILADEAVYVLIDEDSDTIDYLNSIMAKAFLAVTGIQQMIDNPDSVPESDGAFDLSLLPDGVDIFDALASMPPAMLTQITSLMDEALVGLEEDMIIQSATVAVYGEYEAIGINTSDLQNSYILTAGMYMLAISLFSGICTVGVGYLSAKTAAGTARDLRRALFEHVESFSNAEFDKFSVSSLITRTTNDITQIQTLIVMLIRIVFYAPILGIGGIVVSLQTAPSMWWTIALAVVALLMLIASIFIIVLPKFKIIQKLIDRLNLVSRENLSGMLVVRAFNTQNFEEKRFDKANQDLTDTNLFVGRAMAAMMPMMMLIMNGVTLLIIWVGAQQVSELTIQVGDMIAFMQYALQVVMAFLMMSIMFIMIPRAAVSADRIADVLETDPSIEKPKKPKTFPQPFNGRIEFKNVNFRYPGAEEDVLKNINFVAEPGTTTAFIGSTGSGKSTLVNLVPRFYDVTDGSIVINNVDVRDVTQHDLREEIGYVPQKSILFSGTIVSNLRYADEDASSDVISEATDIAQADKFISEKEEGLETPIAQGGVNVSGGQRQRIAIARALVKQAPIYIFDDSFSALDFKTDSALRKALKEKTGDSTILLVTQRVSTVKTAEQIIVLDQGRIVGKGTHEELMETCTIYQEIAESQLGIGDME